MEKLRNLGFVACLVVAAGSLMSIALSMERQASALESIADEGVQVYTNAKENYAGAITKRFVVRTDGEVTVAAEPLGFGIRNSSSFGFPIRLTDDSEIKVTNPIGGFQISARYPDGLRVHNTGK